MKKIIDVGYLRDERLEAYLKDDVNNLLVFNDYACKEALKGKSLYNIKRSLEIVSKYSNQVLILKNILEIMRVDYNQKDFRKAFIDEEQTLDFSEFCIIVSRAGDSDNEFQRELLKRSRKATESLDKTTEFVDLLSESITAFEQGVDKDFLKHIRAGKTWTRKEYKEAFIHVLTFTKRTFEKTSEKADGIQSLERENFLNHFIFRSILSLYLLVLKWLIDRGWETYPDEKMRNDAVDMFYVTFATYYDGVLSKDNKVNSIYEQAIGLIKHFENNTPNN